MKKKLLYIFFITLILVLPIIYWLSAKWGIKLSSVDIRKLRFAFVRDKFLFFATLFNSMLYLIVIYNIFQMDNEPKKENKTSEKKSETSEKNIPNIMMSPSVGTGHINPNDKKWQEMYSGNGDTQDTNNVNEIRNETSVTNISEVPPQTPPQQNIATETITNSVKPDDNILKIPPLQESEVYNTLVEKTLVEIGYTNMGDIYINGVQVDFISIADSDTLLLGKIISGASDIIANETQTDSNTPPSWFTNDEKYPSPVWEIKTATTEFVKMINEVLPEDNGIVVKSLVVIPNANIVNRDDMEPKWKELDVDVVRVLNQTNLPNILDVVPDKTNTEVLESYKKFVETLIKYFSQKYKKNKMKKAG